MAFFFLPFARHPLVVNHRMTLVQSIFRFHIAQIFLMTTVFIIEGHGQSESQTDSLHNLIEIAETDEERIKLSLELCNKIFRADPLSALELANTSLEAAKKINSDSLIYGAYVNQGNVYQFMGNYALSIQLYQQSIPYAQKLASKKLLIRPLGNIGNIYNLLQDYDNALKYYGEALQNLTPPDENSDPTLPGVKTTILNNVGTIYVSTKVFDKADSCFRESLKMARKANNYRMIATALNNQGNLFLEQGNVKLAIARMEEAIEIGKAHDGKVDLAVSYHNMGEIYFKHLKKYDQAEDYFKKTIVLGEEVTSLQTVSDAYENLYRVYQEKGDYKNAFDALVIHRKLYDSLYNEETAGKIAQLEMQFEFDRTQAVLKARQKEKELYFLLAAFGLVLLLIVITLLYFIQRNKARKSQLKQAHLEIETINLRNDLVIKDKELATNIMYLLNKNELINTISEKLLEIKPGLATESQPAVQKVVIDLQSNLQPELWQEFEFRFQQVHENFYKSLNEKFPDLTPSDRRLCAFLKLNMTTKEISAITHQNAKSIDVARTRLRKKLNLTGTDQNLVTFLEQLGTGY